MKTLTTIPICTLILLLQTFPTSSAPVPVSLVAVDDNAKHGGRIETKYDGFNQETVVTLRKMRVTCGGAKGLQSALNETCVSLAVSLHCPGVQLEHVQYAKLQLVFESKSWDRRHPLNERELTVVADTANLKLGTMVLNRAGVEGSQFVDVMREVLEVTVPFKTLQKIVQAQHVEMRVGRTVFSLQERNLAALRDLNNRVKF